MGRHALTFQQRQCDTYTLREPGIYHWRHGGEKHVNDPNSIGNLQVRTAQSSEIIIFTDLYLDPVGSSQKQ